MNIKAILAGVVAFLSALAYGLFQKSRRETEKRKGIEKARNVERKAVDALTEGLTREDKEVNSALARRRARKLRERAGNSKTPPPASH